ncbi:hypothetical protein [Nonomuraea insulae]|uniref:Uncharacterized protein n=1 Tax=Nonomuraea insulae TaxID=1616787 RepID=A0ABW1CNB3_9ACTN
MRLAGEELSQVAVTGIEGVSDEGHQAETPAVGAQDLGFVVVIYFDEPYWAESAS